jgi:hypothetical protein
MSLPASQEHLLTGMEGELRTSEPHLAAMFAMFTRLTRDEQLPWWGQLDARPRRRWLKRRSSDVRRRASRFPAAGRGGWLGWFRAGMRATLLLVPLALFVVIFASISVDARASCPSSYGRWPQVSRQARACLTTVKFRQPYVWLRPAATKAA